MAQGSEKEKMLGRIHSIDTFSTQDGPGVRFVLFVQGCLMRCQYCHNPDTWAITSDHQEQSVQDVLEMMEPFVTVYQESGGGITVSGGEPLLQAEFITELFRACKEKWGLHTAVDTSGYSPTKQWDELLPETDLVILDLKAWDDDLHLRLTGQHRNSTIQFANRVSDLGIALWIRHVLVPGYTDSAQELQSIGAFVSTLSNVEKAELLPYHRMGVEKWHELGWAYPLEQGQPPTSAQLDEAARLFNRNISRNQTDSN